MSNHLAIATVSATLAALVRAAAEDALPAVGMDVATVRPDVLNPQGDQAAVSVYLVHSQPNAALRNMELPVRAGDGRLAQRPVLALDLHYLLTFLGDERRQHPEILLGAVASILHRRPLLDRQQIRDVVGALVQLAGSDLDAQVERVRFTPLPLGLEEMSRLWSRFSQGRYRLSVGYLASVVLIEGPETPQPRPPVRQRNLYAVQLRLPVLESADNAAALAATGDRPLRAGDTLVLRGRNLRAPGVQVLLGDVIVEPDAADVDPERIRLPLVEPPLPAGELRAGVQVVRVRQPRQLGTPPTDHAGPMSNALPLVVHPRLTNVQVLGLAADPDDAALRRADLRLTLAPRVGKRQRLAVQLYEMAVPPGQVPRSYRFEAPSRDVPAEPESAATLDVPVRGVEPGQYALQVEVDGAASLLQPEDVAGPVTGPAVALQP